MNEVNKYQITVDRVLDKNSTYYHQLNFIAENSTVLDVGCACGDFAKILFNLKRCNIYGLEIHEERIKVAKSISVFKDVKQIDLNNIGDSLSEFKKFFDYILLADVLEHLYDPLKSLQDLLNCLKEDGYVIISIPNIAHKSIKVGLLKNMFNYTDVGLLDYTHIRFFTKKSIEELLKKVGLVIDELKTVEDPNNDSSFLMNNKDIPKEILQYIDNDPESHVFQYIIRAKKAIGLVSTPRDEEILKDKKFFERDNFRKFVKKYDQKYFFSLLTKMYRKYNNFKKRKITKTNSNLDYMQYYNKLFIHSYNATDYIPFIKNEISDNKNKLKVIAFYLPQFHTIPENDEWWGKGFTEWTNVTKAHPQFIGHYQPKLPADLGFYDLRSIEVMRDQIEIAKNYGVYGFCFHYYWFSGKRLLEKPIFNYLNNKDLDFPFCLCWANENWTRKWDAGKNLILMEQKLLEGDEIKFIQDIEPFIKDNRYIKINGKPIIIVYRIHLFKKEIVLKMVNVWRDYCNKIGIGDIYLIAAMTHGFNDNPENWGFDAGVEFPPHNLKLPVINNKVKIINPNFNGHIFDFNYFIEKKLYLYENQYTIFKTVFPEWDNTPRYCNRANIYYGAGPETYKIWLNDVFQYTCNTYKEEERFVFINAWNEWAEGAILEPDRINGYKYLKITYEELNRFV